MYSMVLMAALTTAVTRKYENTKEEKKQAAPETQHISFYSPIVFFVFSYFRAFVMGFLTLETLRRHEFQM